MKKTKYDPKKTKDKIEDMRQIVAYVIIIIIIIIINMLYYIYIQCIIIIMWNVLGYNKISHLDNVITITNCFYRIYNSLIKTSKLKTRN
jgi:hypothetical protein